MFGFFQRAHVAEELARAEDGHAKAASDDLDGAAQDDEAGGAWLGGVEERLAARELEDGGDRKNLFRVGGVEAGEGGEVREEGLEVERGLLQTLRVGQRCGVGFLWCVARD